MFNNIYKITLFSFFSVFLTGQALACPKVHSLVDFNCDRSIRITFTGDSITYGRGDYINDDQGGFVLRLQNQYVADPNVIMKNVGVPGFTSQDLLRGFKTNLTKAEMGKTKRRTHDADVIIIKVGVNDWWIKGRTPGQVIATIKRLVKFLRRTVPKISTSKREPFIALSTLIPAKRTSTNEDYPISQREFVNQLNSLLLKYKSKNLPVYIRSDSFPIEMIDESTVHPTPKGYRYLAKIMKQYITKKMPKNMTNQGLIKDADKDGVYDYHEKKTFKTDPKKKDTDGDSYSDGDELFVWDTDPLDPNSHP